MIHQGDKEQVCIIIASRYHVSSLIQWRPEWPFCLDHWMEELSKKDKNKIK